MTDPTAAGKEPGQVAYECRRQDFPSFVGWRQLPDEVQAAWASVERAVLSACAQPQGLTAEDHEVIARCCERQPRLYVRGQHEGYYIHSDVTHLIDLIGKRTAQPDQSHRVTELEAALEEAREFIERYSDVRDGDYGGVEPNEAMQLVHAIDQALGGAR